MNEPLTESELEAVRALLADRARATALRARVTALYATVQTAMAWPGFADHAEEIVQLLKANSTMTLEDAYLQAVETSPTEQ